MASEYIPLLVLLVLTSGFAAIAIGMPSILGPKVKNKAKYAPSASATLAP